MITTKKSKKSEPATTQIVGRHHMKADKVDFSRVSALNKISLVEFQATILAMTKLSDAYGNTKKRLDGNIAVVRSNAELFNRPLNDEEKDQIHAWRVELDRETVKYTDRKKKLSDKQNTIVKEFFTEGTREIDLYGAYTQMLENGSRVAFIDNSVCFMKNMGVIDKENSKANAGSSEVRKVCEVFHDNIGARMKTGKDMLKDIGGSMTTTMNKQNFQKLYLATFRDILVSNGIIGTESVEKRMEEIYADVTASDNQPETAAETVPEGNEAK